MKKPQLVFPNVCSMKMVNDFVKAMRKDSDEPIKGIGFYEYYEEDFQAWLNKEKQMHLGINLDEGMVPGTTMFYVLNHKIIGTINIRHALNSYLYRKGGHIEYSIHPSYRKKGYGTMMLDDALILCQEWKIWPVLLTCPKDNIACLRTIEKCDGYFKDEIENILRYWIGEEK